MGFLEPQAVLSWQGLVEGEYKISSRFLKQIFNTVGHDLLTIFNTSLISWVVPDCLNTATVTPLLKKTNLDSSNFNNCRPISNLPFHSKILEKIVLTQLQSHSMSNHILEKFGFQVSTQHGNCTFKSCKLYLTRNR